MVGVIRVPQRNAQSANRLAVFVFVCPALGSELKLSVEVGRNSATALLHYREAKASPSAVGRKCTRNLTEIAMSQPIVMATLNDGGARPRPRQIVSKDPG